MGTGHLDTPVARMGREIQRIRSEQNLPSKEIAERCNVSLKILFPNQSWSQMTENRINRIIEAYQNPDANGVARDINGYEVVSIPHALKFSLDQVMGTGYTRYAMFWDPLADPSYGGEVLRLLQKHGTGARETIGWAEFLPCSIETREFMCAHHARLFKYQPGLDPRIWRQLMREYNEFGDRRRLLVLSADRTWTLKHFMRISDLERIVRGEEEFDFDKEIRREQIRHLINLVQDDTHRVEMALASDSDIKPIEKSLREYDSLFAIDDKIAVWRSHRGRLSWDEDPAYVAEQRQLLEYFEHLSSIRGKKSVVDNLTFFLQEIK